MSTVKIVVADDDRSFRLLLATVLTRWGYTLILADNGEQAWEALDSPNGPQIAILDWVMPRAHGVEVCRRLRAAELSHYVYVVLLTGMATEADLLVGLEAGADDYLCKPVNFHQLKLRLRAAERVLAAERRHRLLAEAALDGIVTMGGEGNITFANNSAGALFGWSARELIGNSFSELVPGFSAQSHLLATETGGQNLLELIGRHRTGKLIPLEISFAESGEGTQEPLITMVIRNVSERKMRDNQRAHVQKLESIGQLAAGVAHEINTPIQYIADNLHFAQGALSSMERIVNTCRQFVSEPVSSGSLDSLRSILTTLTKELDIDYLSQETPLALEQAIEGTARVAEIVRALKEFSHPGPVETVPVDLNHLLETVALVSKNKWKYSADLKLVLDPELPLINGLPGELNQVFLNLIVNAADAIAEAFDGKPEEKGELLVVSRRDGADVEVRIRDNGTGIPKEAQGKVFDPFFTTKAMGSGTGQGLSIAYSIVTRKHRGSIAFETEVGAGTDVHRQTAN